MTRLLRQRLEKKRNDSLREAELQLQTGDGKDIDPLLRQISLYNSVISALPMNRLTEGLSAALVWLLCASAVGLAWRYHMPETRIILTAESEAANMDIAEAFEWGDQTSIRSTGATIDHMEMLKLPGESSATTLRDDSWTDFSASQIQLSTLHRASGGEFSIELKDTDTGIEIRSTKARFDGKFTLWGDTRISSGKYSKSASRNYSLRLEFPEPVRFRSPENSNVPGTLRFALSEEESMVFYNLQVQGLRLSRQKSYEAGADKFVSSITGGTVQLSDISESVDLNAHEPLLLKGVKGRISELRIGDVIRIRFDGVVKEIFTGPEGFRTDLRPTVLQFIYHQQPLSFFFGAVTFLWGISWSARKLLMSGN